MMAERYIAGPASSIEFKTKEGLDLYNYYDSLSDAEWRDVFSSEWLGLPEELARHAREASEGAAHTGIFTRTPGRIKTSFGVTFGG